MRRQAPKIIPLKPGGRNSAAWEPINSLLNIPALRKDKTSCMPQAPVSHPMPNIPPAGTNSQTGGNNGLGGSLLRRLRENHQITQTEFAKRARISRRKLQKIEEKDPGSLELGEISDFAKGMGYRFMDLVQLIQRGEKDKARILKCSFTNPVSTLRFQDGAELLTLLKGSKDFVGLLNLDTGQSLEWKNLPVGDVLFGYVLKGRLLVDSLGESETVEEKNCFCIPGFLPFELCNTNFIPRVSILLFSRICSDL